MTPFQPCDRDHTNDAPRSECWVCHKTVDLREPHYVKENFEGRSAVHTECAIALAIEGKQDGPSR